MLRKIISVFLILLFTTSVVFAADTISVPTHDNSFSAILDNSYPHSARSLGMGSAGIAVGGVFLGLYLKHRNAPDMDLQV